MVGRNSSTNPKNSELGSSSSSPTGNPESRQPSHHLLRLLLEWITVTSERRLSLGRHSRWFSERILTRASISSAPSWVWVVHPFRWIAVKRMQRCKERDWNCELQWERKGEPEPLLGLRSVQEAIPVHEKPKRARMRPGWGATEGCYEVERPRNVSWVLARSEEQGEGVEKVCSGAGVRIGNSDDAETDSFGDKLEMCTKTFRVRFWLSERDAQLAIK